MDRRRALSTASVVVIFLKAFSADSFTATCHLHSFPSTVATTTTTACPMSVFSDSPEDTFSRLVSNVDETLDIQQLSEEWSELKEIIEDGDISTDELTKMCNILTTDGGKLDKTGFLKLHRMVDSLFDNDNEDDASSTDALQEVQKEFSVKETLLAYLEQVHSYDKAKLPCGFECSDDERESISELIDMIEQNGETNRIIINNGKLASSDVMDEWDLLYTSSRAMTINKSLSGLGRSSSDKAQLQGIRMRLTGNKYLGKAEFVEAFGGGEASFDVVVKGEWMLEDRRNTFTGMPSSSLRVDPDTITYGPSTNQADEWASLGPIKLLDFLYLDADLMILRGTANTDSLFIYQRH